MSSVPLKIGTCIELYTIGYNFWFLVCHCVTPPGQRTVYCCGACVSFGEGQTPVLPLARRSLHNPVGTSLARLRRAGAATAAAAQGPQPCS
jgi:hypothetical protein